MLTRCSIPALVCFAFSLLKAAPATPTDYSAVDAIFAKHCLDCHAAQDPEAKLVLESFETLMQGGESGAAIVPNKSTESLLLKMIEGRGEKDGKKKIMPPGKRKKLEPEEVATIKAWIDAGALAPREVKRRELVTPKITPKVEPRRAINALAYAPDSKLIAIARYGEVELRSAESRAVVRTLTGHRGNVNAVVFSADGSQLFAASGEPALFGEIRQWKVADGTLVRTMEGHKDAIYSLALSPDGKLLATGSYDQKIKFWNVETGQELKTLSGHNGCVFDLSFRPDGKILASASADRTVKLWDVATGERRETLSQSLKELYAVAFSPDGKRLFAGGADNRIRIWQISETAAETTNPILDAKFAHEGAILNLVFSTDGKSLLTSSDDRTVKLWDAAEVKEKLLFEKQPDWSPGLTFALDNKTVVVGRLDGTFGFYEVGTGKLIPPPKPELSRLEPRGIQIGVPAKVKLIGANLTELTAVSFQNTNLTAEILRDGPQRTNEAWIQVVSKPELPRGSYEFSVVNAGGESAKLKLHADDLPQANESGTNQVASATALKLPVSFWGAIDPSGDTDEITYEAKAGDTLVFDVAAKSLGSKLNAAVTVTDAKGNFIASDRGFDGGDPLLVHEFSQGGRYTVRVSDQVLGASAEHFYRLSIGAFPEVVACFPLSVPANAESEVELIGFNLPPKSIVRLKAGKAGEMEVPIDPKNFRTRRTLKVLVSDDTELVETEPNDTPAQAMTVTAPCSVNGRIWAMAKGQAADADLFRFHAKAGQTWIIEIGAAQRGSPLDTKIEVLHADGKPVQRLALQAVRDSHVTFRGIDSASADCRVENWEEMELNQYLFLQGEVVKLFRAPQGPDSGFVFYTSSGKRRTYFDTSATAHANEEPCYIVEPHPTGAKLVANGLPVFPLYYANDDDAERRLGTDSKLTFTAPEDGNYLIRVGDQRGFGGDRFAYRLMVREPKPDFKVTLSGTTPTVNAGSGQGFSVSAERMDGFDGEIKVEVSGLPPGFLVSTPLVIQAGHNAASGTLCAAIDAPPLNETNSSMTEIRATASVNGKLVTKEVNTFGKIKLGDKPKLFVALLPDRAYPASGTPQLISSNAPPASAISPASDANTRPSTANSQRSAGTNDVSFPTFTMESLKGTKPVEITIAPGQTIPAWLKVARNGHDDLITFTVENLPHGVIVDNIGLNGVLMPKGENERQIFLNAAKWVPETDRLCYAVENQAGRQTSLPVLLHVRKQPSKESASLK